jgi:23S rRNA U2552 (ribose-2'-O)-methylase RlmE/FtsJ
MKVYYNHKYYLKFIKDKFDKSNQSYSHIFKEQDNPEQYLYEYDSMNVYPIYPRPIIMPLKKTDNKSDNYDKIKLKEKNNKININLSGIKENYNLLISRIKELNSPENKKEMKKLRNKNKVRRFFDYEIKDTVSEIIQDSNITTAWIKMYEILSTYDLFLIRKDDKINTFHICEHPGKFIYAIKYFIKHKLKLKHDFTYQSLKPNNNPEIFKPDPDLLKKYPTKLDYGVNNGDITDKNNIKYYHKKYKNNNYDLITSDCGLDFSENFIEQESGLYKIFLGAFITNISISSPGSCYVFKLFSFNNTKTIEFLQLVCLFYERVDLVRTMSTKSGSGENYCICVNYNYNGQLGDIEHVIEILLKYMDEDSDNYILSNISDYFLKRVLMHHELITMRRIVTINSLIFRLNNYDFVERNYRLINYVKDMADYYTNYFLEYVDLKKKKITGIDITLDKDDIKSDINKIVNEINEERLEKLKEVEKHEFIDKLLYEDIINSRYGKPIVFKSSESNYFSGGSRVGFKGYAETIDYYKKQIYENIQMEVVLNRRVKNVKLSDMYDSTLSYKYYILTNSVAYRPSSLFNTKSFLIQTNVIDKSKTDNIIIHPVFTTGDQVQYMKKIVSYIKYVLDNNLNHNGILILRMHLLLELNDFYDFFMKTIDKFSDITIYYDTYPLKITYMCDIRLSGYNNNKNHDKIKIFEYHEKISKHLLDELKIYNDFTNIKISNPGLYNVIKLKLENI